MLRFTKQDKPFITLKLSKLSKLGVNFLRMI